MRQREGHPWTRPPILRQQLRGKCPVEPTCGRPGLPSNTPRIWKETSPHLHLNLSRGESPTTNFSSSCDVTIDVRLNGGRGWMMADNYPPRHFDDFIKNLYVHTSFQIPSSSSSFSFSNNFIDRNKVDSMFGKRMMPFFCVSLSMDFLSFFRCTFRFRSLIKLSVKSSYSSLKINQNEFHEKFLLYNNFAAGFPQLYLHKIKGERAKFICRLTRMNFLASLFYSFFRYYEISFVD